MGLLGQYKTHGIGHSISAQRRRARSALYWRVKIVLDEVGLLVVVVTSCAPSPIVSAVGGGAATTVTVGVASVVPASAGPTKNHNSS